MYSVFYKKMVDVKREKEVSIRELSKISGLSHNTLVDFFNPTKPFRILTDKTMAKLHNRLGIDYEIMEKHNEKVKNESRV